MARIHIVEDDPLIAEDLQLQLEDLGHTVSARSDNALDALSALLQDAPDLLLVDIDLGKGSDGVELVRKVAATLPGLPCIFVTGHADPGTLERVKAVRPAGFIRKPFDEDELRVQVDIVLARGGHSEPAPAAADNEEPLPLDDFFVRDKGRLVKVAREGFRYAEADDNYVTLHTVDRKYVLVSTLAAVEAKLAGPHTLRIHRSYLVDLRHITAVEEGAVRLGTTSLPVGKTYRATLMARIRTL